MILQHLEISLVDEALCQDYYRCNPATSKRLKLSMGYMVRMKE